MADAPSDATYLLYSAETDLTNSFVLTASDGLLVNNSGTQVTLGLGPKLTSFTALETGEGGMFAYNNANNTFYFRDIDSLGNTIITNNSFPNLSLGINPESTIQAVRNYYNDSFESGRWALDLNGIGNIVIAGADNSSLNATDVTLSLGEAPSDLDSVGLSSSTGLIIGGTNPITTSGTITVDLPVASGTPPLYLSLTGVSPQTIGWGTGSSSVSSIGITSNADTLTVTGSPVSSGTGYIDLTVGAEWSSIDADTAVDMSDNSFQNTHDVSFASGEGVDLSSGFPILYTPVSATTTHLFTMINSLNRDGTIITDGGTIPACFPQSGILRYALPYSTLAGASDNYGMPCYDGVYVTPTTADQSFQFVYGGTGLPAWAADSSERTDTVTLAQTSVAPTGGGTDIVLGDGSYFVEDPNITQHSVVICTPIGLHGSTDPATGPVTVALNHTTASGQLPVGFVIYGDPTVDNGTTVTYSVMSY